MGKPVTARLGNMGCLQNILPVAQHLYAVGIEVTVYLDDSSIAKEKYDGSLPVVDSISGDSLVLTCLPLDDGYAKIGQSGADVVLVQENPDFHDRRFQAWSKTEGLRAICALSAESTDRDPRTFVTGLPVIDSTATAVRKVDRATVASRLGLDPASTVVVASLPGDVAGCLRMLEALERVVDKDMVLIATSHPKLARNDPEGFATVAKMVAELSGRDLRENNAALSPHEAMALCREHGFFVTTDDSTMSWQGAAAGIKNVFVLPPSTDPEDWAATAPIITSDVGEPLKASLFPRSFHKPLADGHAVTNIAKVVSDLL